MNRPIYRYLADRKWRSYRRKLLMQRLTQMFVVPDVLPTLDPTADVRLAFGRRHARVQPGAFVAARISARAPTLDVQVFDRGERLVSVAVVDLDVPDATRDAFRTRCHFLAANVPVSPTAGAIALGRLTTAAAAAAAAGAEQRAPQLVLPWLPPHAQKGSPYHRLAVVVLQQPDGVLIDAATALAGPAGEKTAAAAAAEESEDIDAARMDFSLRDFVARHALKPIGAHLFRTVWDEGTAEVMQRAGLPGADVELRRKPVRPLKKPQLPLKKKKNLLGLAGLPTKRLKF
jgi:large subunit ribosomal protein L35